MMDAIIILSAFISIYYAGFLISIYMGLLKLGCSKNSGELYPTVTVIIPFRDEENVIEENIRSIKKLDYPPELLEVIYIDDGSTDSSASIVKNLISNSKIKLLKMSDQNSGSKKRALEFAIGEAAGEIIVSSDADCTYNSNWLKSICSKFDERTGFLSGPVEIKASDNFLSKFQKIEFIGLNLSGAGLIGAGKPVIASAANAAFRKSVFRQIGGYGELHNFASGDDELLMQKIKNETDYKIKFNFCAEGIVKTEAVSTWGEFLEQRKRWASKGLFYKSKLLVAALILIYLFYLLIPLNIVFGFIISKTFFLILAAQIIIKFLLEYLIMEYGCRKLFNKEVLKYFLPAQVIQIPYILISAFSGLSGGINWKGRSRKR